MTVALAYDVHGPDDAPALVLAGSLGTDRAMWDGVLPALTERHRVVRIEPRGHGQTPAVPGPYALAALGSDVVGLLDRLGIARADVCGLSIGGMTGLWLAAHAPSRVRRLAVLCTSAHLPGPWGERAQTVRTAGTTEPVSNGVTARWLTPAFATANPAALAMLRAQLLAVDPEGYASCCEAIAAMDLRDDLAGIRAPTLVLAGADDLATPPEHGAAIAERVPGARFAVLEHAAHLAAVERPGDVAARVLAHFEAEEAR